MRKVIMILILFLVFILIINYTFNNKPNSNLEDSLNTFEKETKGIFVSYIDYANLKGLTKEEMQNKISEMVNNIDYFGFNTIILQVSPFNDAIYPSKIYQSSHIVVKKEGDILPFDILKYFIDIAKEKEIDIYAWFNPFRIRDNNNIKDISKKAHYYKWFNTDNLQITENGIYLNPASNEVIEYIISGIKEICENYEIKGVIYDDYFYPNDTIDLNTYEKTDKSINLKKYRLNNINNLIKQSQNVIKSINKDIKFGLSPSGNIENNIDKEYLDIINIMKSDMIDFIIPQLYYGFKNSNKPYLSTLKEWSGLNEKQKDFYVALSLYKSGKIDVFAGKGKDEWIENTDIIKKQIISARNESNYRGFYIYRYEYLFQIHDNNNLNKEITNLKKLIDER